MSVAFGCKATISGPGGTKGDDTGPTDGGPDWTPSDDTGDTGDTGDDDDDDNHIDPIVYDCDALPEVLTEFQPVDLECPLEEVSSTLARNVGLTHPGLDEVLGSDQIGALTRGDTRFRVEVFRAVETLAQSEDGDGPSLGKRYIMRMQRVDPPIERAE